MTGKPRLAALAGNHRLRRLFVVSLVVVGILFTFANPARTWNDQRQEIVAARERNAVLDQQTKGLQAQADTLSSDAEVERLARAEYGLVKPGEEAFSILPAPGAAPSPPQPPPPPKPRSGWHSLWEKAKFWD